MEYLLGYDIGSSSIKASLLATEGQLVASATSPQTELAIIAKQPGWAEQEPSTWWEHVKLATAELLAKSQVQPGRLKQLASPTRCMAWFWLTRKTSSRPAIIW